MNKLIQFVKTLLISFGLLCQISVTHAQTTVDVEKERPQIEALSKLYAKHVN